MLLSKAYSNSIQGTVIHTLMVVAAMQGADQHIKDTLTCGLWESNQRPLKGYFGESLIHGLTHCETVLDFLSRDKVCILKNDCTTTIHCSKWVHWAYLTTREAFLVVGKP